MEQEPQNENLEEEDPKYIPTEEEVLEIIKQNSPNMYLKKIEREEDEDGLLSLKVNAKNKMKEEILFSYKREEKFVKKELKNEKDEKVYASLSVDFLNEKGKRLGGFNIGRFEDERADEKDDWTPYH